MMKKQLRSTVHIKACALVVLVLMATMQAIAQDSVDIAPRPRPEISAAIVAGYGFHDGSFRSLPPVENCCTGFESSGGFSTGGNVAFSIPIANGSLRIFTRLGYQYFAAGFTSTTTEKVYSGEIVSTDARIRHDLDVSWNMAIIGFGAEYGITKKLWLGLWLDGLYAIRAGYEQRETIESPTNITFENGSTVRDVRSGALSDYTSLTGGITGQVRYRIIDGHNKGFTGIDLVCRYMVPLGAFYAHDMQWRESSIDYKLRYLAGGLSITF
jgi:hypothetical protein